MQKARCQNNYVPPTACKRTVSGLFTLLFGVLFTFPSRYWFTIGCQVVFSLGRWSSLIPTEFLVLRGTWGIFKKIDYFRLRDYHPLWSNFPVPSTNNQFCNSSMRPKPHHNIPRNTMYTTLPGYHIYMV